MIKADLQNALADKIGLLKRQPTEEENQILKRFRQNKKDTIKKQSVEVFGVGTQTEHSSNV